MKGLSVQSPFKLGYIPSLDGWRAIAILAVMVSHDTLPLGHNGHILQEYLAWGVYLFFSISGFLICSRILEEEQSPNSFHLKPFYIRRFFRIQPAALTYLGVVALLMLGGVVHESWHFWSGALFLYQNFLHNTHLSQDVLYQSVITGHFWTLAVEEQFYLLLSSVLVLSRRSRPVLLAALLLGIFLAAHALRFILHLDPAVRPHATLATLPFLIFPALLAALLRRESTRSLARRWLSPAAAFLFTALVCLLWAIHLHLHLFSLHTIEDCFSPLAFCSAFWIVATTFHPKSWTSRFLSLTPLRFIGRISYSLYLWHILFFLSVRPLAHVTAPPLAFLSHAPWRYLATFAVAYLSYRFIELPGMRLGHQLAGNTRRAPGIVPAPRHAFPVAHSSTRRAT